MRAIRLYNGKDLFYETDIPIPSLGPNELLIRIHATAVIAPELTWTETHTTGSNIPRLHPIPGHDLSGTIVSLSPDIPTTFPFKVGDEVFLHHSHATVRKPNTPSHFHQSALTAWQAFFDHAGLDPNDHEKNKGKRVLITGAAGGVGVFAVQLAHWAGLHVIGTGIGTGSTRNVEFIRSLAADEVIDYIATSIVDIVLDCVGGDMLKKCWNVVRRDSGVLISVAEPAYLGTASLHPGVKRVWFIVSPNGEQLARIGQ
ncbi:MAG: hypothetical protein M1840_001170 [Geoglossum simile]|nr:MAG: hypothetical protein M1840_001170 [Geoglossum simile]